MIKKKMSLPLAGILIIIIVLQMAGCSKKQENEETELLQSQILVENDSVTDADEGIVSEAENSEGEKQQNVFVDNSYKIYYGEWIIKEISGEHERLGKQQNAEELVGVKLYFDTNEIRINNIVAITNPEYRISILPSTVDYYIPNMPSHKEFGINGDFFTFVSVYTGEVSTPLMINASFYIKDDKTLILVSRDAYYTLERVEYIPNVEDYYESF